MCMQKKLAEAEQYLKQALEEARIGFGEDDPHVAGACNNLAELHRLKKEFPEAEALYQEVHLAGCGLCGKHQMQLPPCLHMC